ncbi:MAG: hypothetical protein JXA22_07165 [Candidatus Thermoplasmatota archaeon]|nr:hypothetical protein [Candidatus Thermoplasmatota archaeon]
MGTSTVSNDARGFKDIPAGKVMTIGSRTIKRMGKANIRRSPCNDLMVFK